MAHAIIESGTVSRAYFVGDAIEDGITLKAVQSDGVLLQAGRETLRLPLSAPDLATGTRILQAQSPVPNPPATSVSEESPRGTPRMLVSSALHAEPVFGSDGALEGYRIFPRDGNALFTRLGLVEGDLVTTVNGITPNHENGEHFLGKSSANGDLFLSILRGGQRVQVLIRNSKQEQPAP